MTRAKCPYCTYAADGDRSLEGHIAMLAGHGAHPAYGDLPTALSSPLPVPDGATAVLVGDAGVDATGALALGLVDAGGAPAKKTVPRMLPSDGKPAAGWTREAWMLSAVDAMRPWLAEVGVDVPDVRISFGWPGGRGKKSGVRGQCWMPHMVADAIPAVFISPDQDDQPTILGIILHEMIHAAGNVGHKGPFAKAAKAVGFVAPFTTSEGKTDELAARIAELNDKLGPINHGRVSNASGAGAGAGPNTQSARMVKCECPDCGYVVRTTRKYLAIGFPVCPCGAEMLPSESDLAKLGGN